MTDMTKLNSIYKCTVCGNIVQVIHAGNASLVCCGQPMNKLPEQTADATKEKHVPVIEKTADGFNVKIGSVPHPMEEQHHIEWIELVADDISYRKYLKAGDIVEYGIDGLGTASQRVVALDDAVMDLKS